MKKESEISLVGMMEERTNCECGCGHNAMVMHQDLHTKIKTFLCKNCEINYVMITLSKKQFFSLLKSGHKTNEFMLHEDFYDEKTGEALLETKIPKGFITYKSIIEKGFLKDRIFWIDSTGIKDRISFMDNETKNNILYLPKSIYDKRVRLIEEVMSLSPHELTLKYSDFWKKYNISAYKELELFHFVVIKKILSGDLD